LSFVRFHYCFLLLLLPFFLLHLQIDIDLLFLLGGSSLRVAFLEVAFFFLEEAFILEITFHLGGSFLRNSFLFLESSIFFLEENDNL